MSAGRFRSATDSAGDRFVADNGNGRVEEYTTTGEWLAFGNGQLVQLSGITVDSSGN
jgi:hypothetical protein